ncbi:MAG: sulfurtransferase complex subunit TusB [Methylococcaceae bacterium]|jgi:tRNA 2-thiouridine synthesizing protein B
MGVMHLVSRADILGTCLARAGESDAILLLSDGVYASTLSDLKASTAPPRLFVLVEDLRLRGISPARLRAGWTQLDYPAFVRLTVEYNPIVTW